jgi:formate dehydrogenase major subunit
VAGLAISFGSGAMTNSIHELLDVTVGDTIFAIGTNATECHPIIGIYILQAKERGAKLIVADPRRTELAKGADLWLRQKPGTDVALLNGMMNVIINEKLMDESFIAERTEDFALCKDMVMKYTPEHASGICRVPAENIIQAARMYAQAENAGIYYTMGITQHTTGVDNVLSIANLAMLTGNLGKRKAGVNPLRGQNNVQGACDMGALPNVYTAYQPVSNPEVQAKFEKAWGGVSLSNKPGTTIPDVLHGLEKGTIKALYILGENPVRSDADINHVKHCMHNVDFSPVKQANFIIVQDIFLTETAEMADVVLPGASFAEKDGTFSNTERKVQRVRKAVEPVGKPDWRILTELLEAMGLPAPYATPEDIFNELRTVTPSYAGITYKRLEEGGIPWPCPNEEHPGTPILHIGKFNRGLGKFNGVEYKPPAENPDEEYPLILTTGRSGAHYHTGTMTRRSWGLNMVHPEDALEINPVDAEYLGIKAGDGIRVSSRRGSIVTKANVTTRVPAGTTFITFHFTETPANLLTNSALDPISKTPELKVCAVKVEKAVGGIT